MPSENGFLKQGKLFVKSFSCLQMSKKVAMLFCAYKVTIAKRNTVANIRRTSMLLMRIFVRSALPDASIIGAHFPMIYLFRLIQDL